MRELVITEQGLFAAIDALEGADILYCDTETVGLGRDAKVRLLQVSNGHDDTVAVDCFSVYPGPLLELLSQRITGWHNAMYDILRLRRLAHAHGENYDFDRLCDSMLWSRLLTATCKTPGKEPPDNGLEECALKWAGVELDKTHQKGPWDGPLTKEQVDYAMDDAWVLRGVQEPMFQALVEAGMGFTAKLEAQTEPAFIWMAECGVPFNCDAWAGLYNRALEEKARLTDELNRLAKPPFRPYNPQGGLEFDDLPEHPTYWNWDSPMGTGGVLDALLANGVKVPDPSVKGDKTVWVDPVDTNDTTLGGTEHPIGKLLQAHRGVSKDIASYGMDWVKASVNGRLYPAWNQLVDTGRTSCGDPSPQTMKGKENGPAYRRCFQASPGRVLIDTDYSQLQLRIACKLSKDMGMLKAYREGQDLHEQTAQFVLGLGDKKPTKDERLTGKRINFGFIFGMSEWTFQRQIQTEYGLRWLLSTCKQYKERFLQLRSGLASWHDEEKRLARSETRTPWGRRRIIPPDGDYVNKDGKTIRMSFFSTRVNAPMQGIEADGIKAAMATMYDQRNRVPGNVQMVMMNHDAIILEADEEHAEEVAAWQADIMQRAMEPLLAPVPVGPLEPEISRSWGGDEEERR